MDVENHNVGDDLLRIERDPFDLRESFGEATRVFMIVVKNFGSLSERDEPGCRQYPCLAHPAAEKLAADAGPADEITRTDEHGSDRSPQRFREAKHHGIEFAREDGHAAAESDRGGENACAIQVNGEAGVMSAIADVGGDFGRVDCTTVHVVAALEFDERGLLAGVNLRANQWLYQGP